MPILAPAEAGRKTRSQSPRNHSQRGEKNLYRLRRPEGFSGGAQLELSQSEPNLSQSEPNLDSYKYNATAVSRAMSKMSPRRGRHQHSQSLQQPSDYEIDIQFLSDIPPPPEQRTNEELNLFVLKRHNREVTSVEYVAPYAVVYQFSPDSQEWEKSGIEGTAFVCGLQPSQERFERFEVTVLNRRGLENFKLELLSTADVEVTEEYIILNDIVEGVPKVYGLWIFSEPPPSSTSHHRRAIAHKIQECTQRVEAGKRPVRKESLNGHDKGIEEGVPMGRQLSLKELFGQQRQQDDSWSIRSHSPRRPSVQFQTTADTDFFRAPPRRGPPHSPAVSAQSNGQGQDIMDMIRKAGEGYRGG